MKMDDNAELPGTFATENASPCMRRVIGCFCVAYSLVTFAVLPLAHIPGPVIPAITTTFGAGVLIADMCTSFLLLVQFREAPSWSMLLLAAAYFYSGAMALLHVLTFPGAWIPETVLFGTPQAVVALHLTVVVTETTAQSRPTSFVSGDRVSWVASIAEAQREKRATHQHSSTGA